MTDAIFKEVPDKESVADWLRRLTIVDFNDFHTLTERAFPFDIFNEILLEVETYYYPCKARVYLHRPITMKRAMTVMRQLVRPHGYTFLTHERLIAGQKCYEYYLSPLTQLPAQPLTVRQIDFS